jgi:glycogen debranching enzyme
MSYSSGGGDVSEEISGFAADAPDAGGRTLVEGSTFVVSGPGGDIDATCGAQGLFVANARALSRWVLRVDGATPEPLAGFSEEPFLGVFVARAAARSGRIEPTVIVERRRYVGGGMREDLTVRNHGSEPAGLGVTIEVAADLADLFEVKAGRSGEQQRPVNVEVGDGTWTAQGRHGTVHRRVTVRAPGAAVGPETIAFQAVVPPRGSWHATVEVLVALDEVPIAPRFPLDSAVDRAEPERQMTDRRRTSPALATDSPALQAAFHRSETDLSALRIVDPSDGDLVAVAAGAPWFMALFGRDALIASSMTVAVNPDLAVGTLRTLARYQGRTVDPLTEEQPGRILHELRPGADASLALGATERYYGSVDATPLFVVVLGQLARWGADPDVIDELLPAADAALEWIARYGDRDGDGLVEYERSTDRGLRNQGWKDSADGINFADGSVAEPPIALVEVAAYVYAAYRARAELAAARAEHAAAEHWRAQAARVFRRINEDFWLPEQGWFAVGLDGAKRPIDALASNIGHVLWAGAAEPAHAATVAEHLLSPAMFTGYGIRTLATTMGAYNPVSYHNGSVWPHDTTLAVAGLARYGFKQHAKRVAAGLVDASAYFSGRLPELFAGFDKGDFPGPVPYPNACSPQAWASASPVGLLLALLGLDPDVPAGEVALDPDLPAAWRGLRWSDIPLGHRRLSVEVRPDGTWSATAPGLTLRSPAPSARRS